MISIHIKWYQAFYGRDITPQEPCCSEASPLRARLVGFNYFVFIVVDKRKQVRFKHTLRHVDLLIEAVRAGLIREDLKAAQRGGCGLL